MIFTAQVVHGSGRGKKLEVPTLNLDLSTVPAELKHGIYACFIRIANRIYRGAMHLGPRPVFQDSVSCEVHILDAVITNPPKEVRIEIIQKLRDVRDFPGPEALIEQMKTDIKDARAILSASLSSL